jgi:hypothetical protein
MFEITVPFREITGKLALREQVGDGDFEGYPVSLAVKLTNKSPIVEIKGRMFTVNIHDIVQAVCAKVLADAVPDPLADHWTVDEWETLEEHRWDIKRSGKLMATIRDEGLALHLAESLGIRMPDQEGPG